MLTHIHIRNFAIIDELNLELYPGMTVMTGETGAGKSIMIDALSLCMGERADANFVREGADKAEIVVTLDISRLKPIQAWLQEHDIEATDECMVKRTLTKDGRSRAYVNGELVPIQQLKTLAQHFIDIHSQHAHHALLKTDTHRVLLDLYGNHAAQRDKVKAAFKAVRDVETAIAALKNNGQDKTDEIALLQFQADELERLNIVENEWDALTEKHERLAHAQTLIEDIQIILSLLSDDDHQAILSLLSQTKHKLDGLLSYDKNLTGISRMLEDARIQCYEASASLRAYVDRVDTDPQSLENLNERIGLLHELARKHRCEPNALHEKFNALSERLHDLKHEGERILELEAELKKHRASYAETAKALSTARQKTAKALDTKITEYMQSLGMPGGVFSVSVEPLEQATSHGMDQIVFMVKTNAGQKAQPLHKVASGGELSRISLAIQVTIMQDEMVPVIVFDEVDVGIGGGTAEIVGHLLNRLGEKAQVLCVTHLPQVAAQGDQHFYISKSSDGEKTQTQVTVLDNKGRIEEIARMLGGVKITDKTLQHAQEMLEK